MGGETYRYSKDLAVVLDSLKATQKLIRPHCPWQNGKVERLNRTLATEWAYRQAFTSNAKRSAALAPWIEFYNTERRHTSLGGEPPISRLECGDVERVTISFSRANSSAEP